MAYTTTWNASYETLPTNIENISDGAARIRNVKESIRERIAKDHYMDVAGTDADHGEHSKITLQAPLGADPSNVANKGFIYTKDVSSVVELFWEDESGNVLQLTSGGKIILGYNNGYGLAGDATAGRVIRSINVLLEDGTAADTIKGTITSLWNGDTDAATDDIAKGATTGNYTLDSNGYYLDISSSVFTGNVVAILGLSYDNTISNTHTRASVQSNGIRLGGVSSEILVDWTSITYGVGLVERNVVITYLTDA